MHPSGRPQHARTLALVLELSHLGRPSSARQSPARACPRIHPAAELQRLSRAQQPGSATMSPRRRADTTRPTKRSGESNATPATRMMRARRCGEDIAAASKGDETRYTRHCYGATAPTASKPDTRTHTSHEGPTRMGSRRYAPQSLLQRHAAAARGKQEAGASAAAPNRRCAHSASSGTMQASKAGTRERKRRMPRARSRWAQRGNNGKRRRHATLLFTEAVAGPPRPTASAADRAEQLRAGAQSMA